MLATRIERQRQVMAEEGLDALVSFSPESVGYAAGYMVPSQTIPIRKRVFATVVTPEDEAFLLASVEYNEAKRRSRIADVRPYDEFAVDPMRMLADTLAEFGAAGGRIGLELDFLPAQHWRNLEGYLAGSTLVDAEEIIARMRAVKTVEEMEHIRRIARIVHEAHESVAAAAEPGWTEKQMALHIHEHILGAGGDGISLLVIGAGERSVYANCPPTDRAIEDGDLIRIDIFAHAGSYMSDIARTLVVGEGTPRQHEVWAKLCEAQTALLEWIRPGASTREVMERYSTFFGGLGLDQAVNFVGHSFGLTLHEEPFLNLKHDEEIVEGMVFAIEPVYFGEEGGYQLEDEILVVPGGCELLSDGRGALRTVTAGLTELVG
ncbi:MAG TPA: Xaa-Pro peptidase family protein [Gaiellaceae bacterium]|nr:Xaa-Pro peptidase family protein [Gaiellaceae bacterium]